MKPRITNNGYGLVDPRDLKLSNYIKCRILDGLAEGKSLTSILKSDPSMPQLNVLRIYLKKNPEFQKEMKSATSFGLYMMMDKNKDDLEDVRRGNIEGKDASVLIDGTQKLAKTLFPEDFGERRKDVGGELTQAPVFNITFAGEVNSKQDQDHVIDIQKIDNDEQKEK